MRIIKNGIDLEILKANKYQNDKNCNIGYFLKYIYILNNAMLFSYV